MQRDGTVGARSLDKLERRNIWLWSLSALLLLSLAGTVVSLYLPPELTRLRGVSMPPEARAAVAIGITGLTVLFSLYMFLRQLELKRLRAGLIEAQLQEETLRSRLLELSSLFDAAGQVQKADDLGPMLEAVNRRVLTCLEADRCSILLIDPASGALLTHADSDGDGAPDTIRPGEGLAGWVAQNNEPLVLNNDELVRRFASEVKPGTGITAALCLPLASRGEVIGVLNVSRTERDRPFTAGDARLMTIFADHVAHAIRRIQDDAALQRRVAVLERARAELGRSNRVKEYFLEASSEELRGPLTCILAYADFLARDETPLDAKRRETFARILREQASRLEEIVTGSGLLLRLESPSARLQPVPIPLGQVLGESLASVREAASLRGVTLVPRIALDLPAVPLDRESLTHAVRGLLSQAIHLSEPGGSLRIEALCRDGYARVEVNGSRLAVAPQDLPKVFDLCEIEDGRAARGVQGLGLGLHLLRRVVELHGGRVWAEGRPGEGSSFFLALPLAGDGRPTAAPAGEPLSRQAAA